MKITPQNIKPKKRGVADFWSWQLYQWVLKNPLATFIHKDSEGVLYIGTGIDSEGWLHGAELRQICGHGQKLQTWAYRPGSVKGLENITEEFWAEYNLSGICAIHGDFAHKWKTLNDYRSCDYCGKEETRITKMVEKTEWVAA